MHRPHLLDPIAAVRECDFNAIRSHSFDIKVTDQSGRTILIAAISNRDTHLPQNHDIIHYLISLGCDVNARDNKGVTPLHYCCRTRCAYCIKLLIEANANCNALNIYGESPLYFAAIYGPVELARALLDGNGNSLLTDHSGCFPIEWASYFGHLDIIKEFVVRNPDIYSIERAYQKVRDSRRTNTEQIVDFLHKTVTTLKSTSWK